MGVLNTLLEWIYPPRCALCDTIFTLIGPRHFCEGCRSALAYIGEPTCRMCGLAAARADEACPQCRGKSYAFSRNVSLFAYEDTVADAIRRFKFHGRPDIGKAFGLLMAEKCLEAFPERADYIVPVPLHRTRQRKRGYNQAAILAAEIGAKTGIPVKFDGIVRMRRTKPQSALRPGERANNMVGAFKIRVGFDVQDAVVLLIDDIFTTGSTLNACAKALREAGAADVRALTLSIALPKNTAKNTAEI